ncbi:MAG: serine hydrolase domain-containing protein [Planctomycetota bacterium]
MRRLLLPILLCVAPLAAQSPPTPEPGDARPPERFDRAGIEAAVRAAMAAQEIPGVVVGILEGDALAMRLALGQRDLARDLPMTTDCLFQVGSVTKSLTACLLARLCERGTVALDDPLSRHWPEDAPMPAALGERTLRQLATHTAGLPRNPANRRNLPDSPSVMLPYSHAELHAAVADVAIAEAGDAAEFAYSNFSYAVLGHALEHAAGQPLAVLLRDEVFSPLGMSSSGIEPSAAQEARLATPYWTTDTPRVARPRWQFGEVAAFAGVFSSVDDLARFVAAQYAADDAFLPVARRAELHRGAIPVAPEQGRSLGIGWFVQRMPTGTVIGHGGEVDGFSANVAFLPKRRIGLVVLANLGGRAADAVAMAVLGALQKR